jgi:2-polyprenyl-3-methyl-5-hydroxy-6-metoxy-1,4-benzoquinol methylase
MDNFEKLSAEVAHSTHVNEKEYFEFHKNRFRRFDEFLDKFQASQKKVGDQVRVLEIGSHYLHTSVLLAGRGYSVDAMDVEEFWSLGFIKDRAIKFGIQPLIENDISKMKRFEGIKNSYDLVVFTEIMEHITFNPVQFWRTLYELMGNGTGCLYISTPNAFALPNFVRNLKNMLLFKSIGITVEDIFSKVTYGHHWKEYSAKEIRSYFHQLSDDFEVEINPYHYKYYRLRPPFLMFKVLSKIGNWTKIFAEDLEVIVKLKDKKGWKLKSPQY